MKDQINSIKGEKSIAMLAPTFVLDFEYPAIIGMLRELGFNKVTELTFGARIVNWHMQNMSKIIRNNNILFLLHVPLLWQ